MALALGAVICPLAEDPNGEEAPAVNSSTTGIVLCVKCQTFLNPYITFVDGCRKWQCNNCAFLNNVPAACFSYLDPSGKAVDLVQRPEMRYGSVEFVSPPDEVWPPLPPVCFFLVDVSISAVRSGVLEAPVSQRDNEMSRKLMSILGKLREDDASYYQSPELVRQDEEPREGTLQLADL